MINGVRHIPRVNGIVYGWASVNVCIASNVAEIEIRGIDFEDDQVIENVYGAGQNPIGRGYGRISYTASITLLKDAVEAIRAGSITGRLQDIPPFDIIVMYVKADSAKIVKHVIHNCIFTKDSFSGKEGDTQFEVTLPLLPSHITWNK